MRPLTRRDREGQRSPGAHRREGHGARGSERDRLKQLRAFCHAARRGNFTRAAEHLHLSQPALSLQIRSLEAELGVSLFVRKGPHIELSAEGRSLYARALPLVEGIDRLHDTFEEHFRDIVHPLHIAAGETVASCLLPRYLEAFRERHGDVDVTVRVGAAIECLSWLRGHEADLAFAAMDVVPDDLEFHPLFSSPYELITPEDHPLSALALAHPRHLVGHPQVAHARHSDIRHFSEMFLRQHGVAPDVVVSVDGWESVKECVEAGLGIAIVPRLCLSARDRVRRVPFASTLPPRRYGCVTRRDGVAPLAVERFLSTLAEN